MNIEQINSMFTRGADGKASMSGVDFAKVAEQFGSPFYIYDAATIRSQYQKLRKALPERVEIFYAIKPNPTRAIVELLCAEGAGLELASMGDLVTAETIGVDPSNLAYAGPGKSDAELEKAISMGIYGLHAESIGEVRRINQIAGNLGKTVEIGLRVNTKYQLHDTMLDMGGEAQKFGIDEDKLDDVITQSLELENIVLSGIHVYSATGIMNAEDYIGNVRYSLEVAKRANKRFKIKSFDYGGGYGVDYSGEAHFDLSTITEQMEQLLAEFDFLDQNETRIITEPGRFLVAESGVYVTRVLDRKTSLGKEFLTCDGGVHQFLRTALVGVSHPITNLSRDSDETSAFDIGGNLCTPVDYLAKDLRLPSESQEGDLIGVMIAGAYCFTASMLLFLNNATPIELLVDNGKVQVIRESMDTQFFLKVQPGINNS